MRRNEKISLSLKKHHKTKRLKRRIRIASYFAVISLFVLFTAPKVLSAPFEWYPQRLPEAKERNIPMREWVLNTVESAGFDRDEIDCLVTSESGWKPWAMYDNPNGAGVDRGLFMWNSRWHPEVSNEDAFNYKKATEHFIRVAKANGNLNAWWGWVYKCQKYAKN